MCEAGIHGDIRGAESRASFPCWIKYHQLHEWTAGSKDETVFTAPSIKGTMSCQAMCLDRISSSFPSQIASR